MNKNQHHKVGSPNISPANQKSKSSTSRNRSCQKSIPKTKTLETFLQTIDSPYKNSLSEIKLIDLKKDDTDDFKTPVPIRKTSKLSKPLISKVKKNNSKTKESTVLKITEQNFGNLDVNPENLQLALALSKSTFQTENSQLQSEENFGNVLERFGFKSNKTKPISDKLKNSLIGQAHSSEISKKRKNSKFRYITPILMKRTNEDREALITTKISFILHHIEGSYDSVSNQFEVEIFSEKIKEYHYCKSKILNLNSLVESEIQEETYLVKTLNLPVSRSKCGYLLKKWENIPGRDKSPSCENKRNCEIDMYGRSASIETNNEVSEEMSTRYTNCSSPDLFDSDSESTSNEISDTPNCPKVYENEVCLTTVFKSSSGIEHFESVCEDSLIVSKEINKLMEKPRKSKETSPSHSKNACNTINDIDFDNETINNSVSDNPEGAVNKLGEQSTAIFSTNYPFIHSRFEENFNATIDMSSTNSHNYSNSLPLNTEFANNFGNLLNNGIIQTNKNTVNFVNSDMNEILKINSLIPLEKCDSLKNQESTLADTKIEYSCRISFNNTDNLNVTDYVNELLNKSSAVLNNMHEELKEIPNEQTPDYPSSLSQSTSSQESIVISDEELNYSSRKSKDTKNKQFYDLCSSDEEEVKEIQENIIEDLQDVHTNLKMKYSQNTSLPDELQSEDECFDRNCDNVSSPIFETNQKKPVVTPTKNLTLPPEIINVDDNSQQSKYTNVITPKRNLIIKTKDVTPMANYDKMSSPQIRAELDKFGLKPLKRRRGIQLLKYIYETTHPFVDFERDENSASNEELIKRRKTEDNEIGNLDSSQSYPVVNIVGDSLLQNERNEDLIFEKKNSKKVSSCAVPLQIIWYNFVSCNPELQKNILLYEPLQLEVIHSMLKDQSGCKFKLEDLINFLDKKCITFRTSQWQKQRKKNKIL